MTSHTHLWRVCRVAAIILLALAGNACQPTMAAEPDGPYVVPGAGGWQAVSVEVTAAGAQRRSQRLGPNASVEISAVGTVPDFQVALREAAADAPGEIRTAPNAPLFVIADTHGEYETLVATLRAHEIIGAKLEWQFARGHLVVLGDVFDRGPNHLEILWLLYKLEAEAAKAGGGVQLVLGNHETMVMRGDLRYLHAKYVETAQVLQESTYAGLFAAPTLLGQWLRSKPAMLKVNDLLCMHAGVSRALVDSGLSLADINATLRAQLSGAEQGAVAELVMGSFGPLWYRGYFSERDLPPTATADDVDLALKTFNARRMVVGHTIVDTVKPLYEGRVIAVQARPFAGLLIRKGQLWMARPDGGIKRLVVTPAH